MISLISPHESNYLSTQENPKVKINFLRQIVEVKSAPTDILWVPDERYLLVACANGTLIAFHGNNMVPSLPTIAALDIPGNDVPTPTESVLLKNDAPRNDVAFLDDSDDEVIFGGTSQADGHGKNNIAVNGKQNPFIDDEANAEDDDIESKASSDKISVADSMSSDSDHDDDMAGAYPSTYNEAVMSADHRHVFAPDLPEKQPPFAPSSSPLDLPRRYLCWNSIGSLTLRHNEGDDITNRRNTVDIHFTDSGVRRPISFTDNLGFILGSLGEDGGIFATDLVEDDDDDDDDLLDQVGVPGLSETTRQAVKKSRRSQKDINKPTGSSIYFHRYETFGALREKDWYLTLPNGERVLGCATGEGWAAVMTSRRFLRLFSSGGNQGQIMWLDGPPITMVGRYRFVAVFYHQGEPFRDGTQNIGYKLIDAMTNLVLASGTATCISNRATLTWAGFSNDGSLIVMDSEGMVSMLVKSNISVSIDRDAYNGEWVWMPVLDTLGLRKASDDSFWPVTVYDGKMICIPLKGKVKYPDAARRPVTANLSLKLPLARNPLATMYVLCHCIMNVAMKRSGILLLTFIFLSRNVLEELSIRADLALSQKKVIQEITDGVNEDFYRNYHALSAQVVCLSSLIIIQFVFKKSRSIFFSF
jgi:chromosome transmission fidelity protein 4